MIESAKPRGALLVSRGMGYLAGLLGITVLFGWATDNVWLRSVQPGWPAMVPLTALCFVFSAASLLLLNASVDGSKALPRHGLGQLSAVLVLALGLIRFGAFLVGRDLGIDLLGFESRHDIQGGLASVTMAPATALAFSLLGSALLLSASIRPQLIAVAQSLLLGTLILAWLGLNQYLFDLEALAPFSAMAMHTALGLAGLSVGILTLRSDTGLFRWLLTSAPASEKQAATRFHPGMVFGFVLAIAMFVTVAVRQLRQNAFTLDLARTVASTHQVRYELSGLLSAAQDIETGARGYALAGNPEFLEPFEKGQRLVPIKLQLLRSLASNNTVQQRHLHTLEPLLTRRLGLSQQLVELRRSGSEAQVQAQVASGQGKAAMDAVRATIAQMDEFEVGKLNEGEQALARETATTRQVTANVTTLGLALLCIVFTLLWRENRLRCLAETELLQANTHLEQRVQERTADLIQAQEGLTKSEEQYRSLVDKLQVGIAVHGLRAEVRLCNPKALALLGLTEAQFVGKSAYHPDWRVLGEDGTRLPATEFPVPRVIATGQPVRSVTLSVFRPKTQDYIWLLVDTEPQFSADGTLTEVICTFSDITARRQAESERDRLFNSSIDPLCVASVDGYFKQLNPAWTRLLGWTAAELMAKPWLEFVHPDDRPATVGAKATLDGGESVINFENRYQHRDGTYRWLQWKATPMPEGGKIFAVARNITERKAAEEVQALFRAQIEQASDAIEVIDPETGRFLDMNERGCLDLGYTREEILQRTVFEVDPTGGLDGFKQFVQDLRTHGRIERETVHHRKDGTTFPVEIAVRLVRLDREYLVTVARNITERKKAETELRASEERFRTIFQFAPVGIAIAEMPSSRFISLNHTLCDLLGYTEEELLRLTVKAITHPDDLPADARAIRRLLAGEIRQDVTEKRYLKKNGETVWASRAVTLINTQDGTSTYAVAMIQDLTARKRAEAEQERLEDQLRQSQKLEAIGTLAGGIAHDFNNILAGIAGFTSLARTAAKGNVELCDYLEEISRAGNRAADLVQQILAFSRVGDQAQTPLQWRHIVAESVKLLRAAVPSSIEIEAKLAADLPAVLGNATQLHQIMMNLGTNAAYAMRDRTGRLSISLDRCTIDEMHARNHLTFGIYVRLTVSDTGCGMDAKTLERSFEPFFTTKAPGEGTGLGLSVIHGIVRSHYGEIQLQSVVDQGTTCEILLPAITAQPLPEEPVPKELPRGCGERILIVDDEPALVKMAEHTLLHLGYAVEGKIHVMEALAQLERDPHAFQLVFTDQTMPGMTGLEFTERLQALRPDLPVILASGFSNALTPDRIKKAGVREILSKPYTISSLALALRRHLPPAQKI